MNHEPTLAKVQLTEGLGLANEAQPPPEPAGFRTRYRSEPGMIGQYPWTYADQGRRRIERPSCEYEDLFTADHVRAAVAEERERCALLCEAHAGMRGTGAWVALTAAADRIRGLIP